MLVFNACVLSAGGLNTMCGIFGWLYKSVASVMDGNVLLRQLEGLMVVNGGKQHVSWGDLCRSCLH